MENEPETGFSKTIYTIGHSNHALEVFFNLLERSGINVLADVRSSPFARFSRHFNHDPLKIAMQNAGLKYLFLGKELGGRPKEDHYYDSQGYIDYASMAESVRFKVGIERLVKGAETYRVAIMCAEENPVGCHRRLLIGRVLAAQGISLEHIRANGEIQCERELLVDEKNLANDFQQLTLFSTPAPEEPWRSVHPVKRKLKVDD